MYHIQKTKRTQIQAIQLLMNLGYTYLNREAVKKEIPSQKKNVLLEEILRAKLKKINHINDLSEENIQSAVQALKNDPSESLFNLNEKIYRLLTQGIIQNQVIDGINRSFKINYIDWHHIENNDFHVVAALEIEHIKLKESRYLDIVLFVNGIPFVVIACESANINLPQLIDKFINAQQDLPYLFMYSQLLISINHNHSKYGTVGSSQSWHIWREFNEQEPLQKHHFEKSVKLDLYQEYQDFKFDEDIDKYTQLYNLCKPKKLLDLIQNFIIFERGIKKIARHYQYFVIKNTLAQIGGKNEDGSRKGGMICQTQGAGKSLTMVMLAKNIAVHPSLRQPTILLISDRQEISTQLNDIFKSCGLDVVHATSGKRILDLLKNDHVHLISSVINKFEKALNKQSSFSNQSSEIFVLIDDYDQKKYAPLNEKMKKILPNASYIGFFSTLLGKEENQYNHLIEPSYSMQQAIDDQVIVPLLYEKRLIHTKSKINIDLQIKDFSQSDKNMIKKRYHEISKLNHTHAIIYCQALDISNHYKQNWQDTGFKAQIIAKTNEHTFLFKKYLDEFTGISSEIMISAPHSKEDECDVIQQELNDYWKNLMAYYGNENQYYDKVTYDFINTNTPEILIVKDKLLKGFDAPRNKIIYLCNKLENDSLFHAITRVNRFYEDKEFGYIIDYVNALDKSNQSLGWYKNADDEINQLPDLDNELMEMSKYNINKFNQLMGENIDNKKNILFYVYLNKNARSKFYSKLLKFAITLKIAFSNQKFMQNTSEELKTKYKDHLKTFISLQQSILFRYAENHLDIIDPSIKKMLNEEIKLEEPFNIFDQDMFKNIKNQKQRYLNQTKAASADIIAYAMKKNINEKMEAYPARYLKFNQMVQNTIDLYHQGKISETQYLKKICALRDDFVFQKGIFPVEIKSSYQSKAYYSAILDTFDETELKNHPDLSKIALQITLKINALLIEFSSDQEAQKNIINALDDFYYDIISKEYPMITIDIIDQITQKAIKLAISANQLKS
jgi:type I restriction enzyme R subunit